MNRRDLFQRLAIMCGGLIAQRALAAPKPALEDVPGGYERIAGYEPVTTSSGRKFYGPGRPVEEIRSENGIIYAKTDGKWFAAKKHGWEPV